MNYLFNYPDVLKIKEAIFYDVAPIPLPVPFKDGTGGIRHASFFQGWLKVYDEDGFCGQGPASRIMVDFFVPRLLEQGGKPIVNGLITSGGRSATLAIKALMLQKCLIWTGSF